MAALLLFLACLVVLYEKQTLPAKEFKKLSHSPTHFAGINLHPELDDESDDNDEDEIEPLPEPRRPVELPDNSIEVKPAELPEDDSVVSPLLELDAGVPLRVTGPARPKELHAVTPPVLSGIQLDTTESDPLKPVPNLIKPQFCFCYCKRISMCFNCRSDTLRAWVFHTPSPTAAPQLSDEEN